MLGEFNMATRQFKLMGNIYSENSAGIMKINGIEVFNGLFPSGPIYTPGPEQTIIVEGSFDNDDSVNANIQVELSVTQGSIGCGLILFNKTVIIANPVYTSEQFTTLSSRAVNPLEMTAVEELVASPPFTAEELSVLNSVTSDPAILQQKKSILISHNAWWYALDEVEFSIPAGLPRTNTKINDAVVPVDEVGNYALLVNANDVLTFDQTVPSATL